MKKLTTIFCTISIIFCIAGMANALTITTGAEFYTAGPGDPVDNKSANSGAITSHVTHDDHPQGDAWGVGSATANADASGLIGVSATYGGRGYDFTYANARASFSETYFNNSGIDQSYSFSFGTEEYLSIFGTNGATVNPSVMMTISFNGATIWDSYTNLSFDRDPDWDMTTTNADGEYTVINNSTYDGIPDLVDLDVELFGDYAGLLDLGTFAAGSSFDLEYSIFALPSGMDSGEAFVSGSFWGSVTSTPSTTAPEPATLLLLGTGLVGIVKMRKKIVRNR